MTKASLDIESIQPDQEIPYDILLLADPCRKQIDSYVHSGSCYIAHFNNLPIGAIVLAEIHPDAMEIKNIAVKQKEQRKGYGKALLQFAEKKAKEEGYKELYIATGNSSIHQIDLYQKQGFVIDRIEKDFFLEHYDEPILENGILCQHKVVMVKPLPPLSFTD